MAQLSLSKQIQALERDVGAQLLTRTIRRVELTAAGEVFFTHARQLLDRVDAATLEARRAARGEVGQLDIAFVDSAAYALLPPILRQLHERLPDVNVTLREVSVETNLDELHDAVDLAMLRDVRAVAGMRLHTLLDERLVAAVPADHPLAAATRLRLADLTGVGVVLPRYELAPNVHDRLREIFAAAGVRPHVTHQALQYATVLGLVAAGYGVALVPAAVSALAPTGVRYVPVADNPTTELILATSTQRWRPVVEHATAIALETADATR